MSCKPIDQVSKALKPQGQDGIWATIRGLREFTITDIARATDIHRDTISSYIKRLEAGGYVEKQASISSAQLWILKHDGGVHAPRLKKDGTAVTKGGGVTNMWRSMRMLGQFTPRDLALHSNTDSVSVTDATVSSYCSMLLKAEYLRVLEKAVPGKRQATYRFVRDTGPKAPQIQRVKQVFDPNLNEVTYTPEPRS